MTDRSVDIDAALERVIALARAHLEAVKAADGALNDDAVWDAYVALNNASHDYDGLLNDEFGEVTPWDVESISGADTDGRLATLISTELGRGDNDDPYPPVVSVRQRRDYRVPSVAALLRVAEEGRPTPTADEVYEPILTVADAVLELMQSGDGSLAMLDIPELDPLDGVVLVAEVAQPLAAEVGVDGPLVGGADPAGEAEDTPFRLGPGDRAVGLINERALADFED